MTDPTHSDDETVSSYIDGEATLDEVVRVQADPELLAEVQEFEAVAELVSTPVAPLPQSDVDEIVGNALTRGATSDRITDLAAVRAIRTFNPQRLATIAATLIILAGAVGALVVFNSDDSEEMFSGTADDSAADSADFADDGGTTAESDSDEADDAPEEYDHPQDDTSDMEETADWALRADAGQTHDDSDDMASESASTMTYRLLDVRIAESYATFDEMIQQTGSRWQELVEAGATPVPQTTEEQGIAEQALAGVGCGPILHAHIDTLDHSLGSGGISVGETTVAGRRFTVVMVELSVDAAVLLAAVEPGCAVDQLADLGP